MGVFYRVGGRNGKICRGGDGCETFAMKNREMWDFFGVKFCRFLYHLAKALGLKGYADLGGSEAVFESL